MRRTALVMSAALVWLALPTAPVHADTNPRAGLGSIVEPLLEELSGGRLFDSRPGSPTIDGVGAGGGILAANAVVHVPVAGRAGALATSDAIVFNIIATGAIQEGWARVWACAQPEPDTSTVNYAASGAAISNTAVVALGSDDLCIRVATATHIILDLAGQFADDSGYEPQTGRLLDSRKTWPSDLPHPADPGRLPARQWRKFPLPLPWRPALAPKLRYIFNVTVVDPLAGGYLSAASCAPGYLDQYFDPFWHNYSIEPDFSTINFEPHQTIANMFIDEAPDWCIYASADTHVIVDLVGVLPLEGDLATPAFGIVRSRVLDTRSGRGVVPAVAARIPGGVIKRLVPDEDVYDAGSDLDEMNPEVRASVRAMNIVATGASTSGYLQVFPCGDPIPGFSNMNFAAGQTIAHLTMVPIAFDGSVCVFASTSVHLIIDGQAWFTTANLPLQTALALGPDGCAGYVRTRTTLNVTIPFGASSSDEVTHKFDIIGGTPPYTMSVDAPDGWEIFTGSTLLVHFVGNVQSGWKHADGLTTPTDFTVTVTDQDGATNTLVLHYTGSGPGFVC